MGFFDSVSPSRRLFALFLILTVAPAAGLAWLGWRLLEQDRALEAQRTLERQEYAADLVTGAISRQIAVSRQQLAEYQEAPVFLNPSDAVIVTFQQDDFHDFPPGRLLYYPVTPQIQDAPEAPFLAGERLEFSQQNYAKAIEQFRDFANSTDPVLRAGAQFRIARNERKRGNIQQALDVYEQLSNLEGAFIAGVPAELAARQARCVLFEEMGREDELQREAGALFEELLNGQFRLTRPIFLLHAEQVCQWLNRPDIDQSDRLALSTAAEWLWQEWQEASSGGIPLANTMTVRLLDRCMTILSDITQEGLTALIAGPQYVEAEWLIPATRTISTDQISISLRDTDGNPVNASAPVESGRRSFRLASDTGLPWTVVLSTVASSADTESLTSRRRLLLLGLALAAILVITTGYALTRSLSHELDVARLKSEFVAAVSHEFRTPLATLRQLTDNLADGRVSTDERRSAYYQTQRRATNRLSRLVERLLDFGRMEAGALRYHFEPVNLGTLAHGAVDEFENIASTSGREIKIDVDPELPEVHADPEALAQALWNLLDNAIKYSPGKSEVWVDVIREGNFAAIQVRDKGLGISQQEQKNLFQKFFRGAAADGTHVKGAGIGLAMVDYIVRAHRGRIRVESEPGKGSTFTILLKLEAS